MNKPYKNKAHQRAYENGYKAAQHDAPFCPYGTENSSSVYFRRAWMRGFDEASAAASAPSAGAKVLRHA